MIIPWQQLSEDALNGIIEEFVMREGTDYGVQELSFNRKKQDVKNQLKSEKIVVVYSEIHETVNLMLATDFSG